MEEKQRLHQMRAVVTGAATGIGEAIARVFAQHGASVVGVDLPDSGIEERFKGVPNVTGYVLDVSEEAAPERMVELIDADLGGLDILVNNAGISDMQSVEKSSDAQWDHIMANNLRPVFRLSRTAIPLLKRSPAGRIINLGSIYSFMGGRYLSAYAASKHAVAGLTKSLAGEVGKHGITVNYIQPGAIMTNMTRPAFRQNPELRDQYIAGCSMGRLGEPLDVARVALFLASDDAAYVTGTGIVVDGGTVQQT
ncbi:MAG: SDR family NAD(P)-dependent oxidoreductase [Pseudomonadota bacterium]